MCPLLTGEVSKSFEPYSAMDLSGNDLREIDSVNKVSKMAVVGRVGRV